MFVFRSFRLRVALLTAVVAGIVFGLFSIAAYSLIHGELEKNVETRIMVEARQAFGWGLAMASWRERMGRMRDSDDERSGESVEERSVRSAPGEQQRWQEGRPPASSPGATAEVEQPGEEDPRRAIVPPPVPDGLADEIDEEPQVFANHVAEIDGDEREELFRSPNWPAELPATGLDYGQGKSIEPTEVNDLLRGRRSRPMRPPTGMPGPRREPRREPAADPGVQVPDSGGSGSRTTPEAGENTSDNDNDADNDNDNEDDADAGDGDGDEEPRRSGSRGRRGNRGWRGGFFLTRQPHFHYRSVQGELWRIGVFTSEHHEVIVAASLTEFTDNVQKLRSAFAIAIPAAVILIALGAWVVSGQAIRPIRRIADTAEQLTASGLSQRIPEPDTGDELQRLAVVLNGMLDRLEDGFKQATRFSADASHELKTPLTIMQGELEAALREAPPASREQSVYVSQLEEVTRLKRIVASLLLLSRADAGQLNLTRERIDLSSNFAEICEDAEILAEAAGITLEAEVAPDLAIVGDRALLQQVFQNLISNAVKYNQPDGRIVCRLSSDASGKVALIDFENTGMGIPEEDQGKVFLRFHRADAARGREVDGFGLGLNLALEIVRAHHGTLELLKSDAESTLFRLTMPLA